MATFFSFVLTISAAALAVPVAIFFIEVVAAVAFGNRNKSAAVAANCERIAVLVPAHNESTGLLPTLADVTQQLRAGDRLMVVADNCTDDTVIVASAAGAEVVERDDPARRGKGYALDYGLQCLSSAPPEIVIMVDADCRLAVNAIDELTKTCAATRRPVLKLGSVSETRCSLRKLTSCSWANHMVVTRRRPGNIIGANRNDRPSAGFPKPDCVLGCDHGSGVPGSSWVHQTGALSTTSWLGRTPLSPTNIGDPPLCGGVILT